MRECSYRVITQAEEVSVRECSYRVITQAEEVSVRECHYRGIYSSRRGFSKGVFL